MGCSSSTSEPVEEYTHPNTPVQKPGAKSVPGLTPGIPYDLPAVVPKVAETVPQAYQRLDEEICLLESTCPGPRLLTAEAWVDHLTKLFDEQFRNNDELYSHHQQLRGNSKLMMDTSKMVDIPNGIPDASKMGPDTASQSVDDTAKIAIKLDIALNPDKAARQEEFIARISRSAMELESERFRADMIDHARDRALHLRQSFGRLKVLYLELDHLLAAANNGTYSSLAEERFDSELESLREIRDRLGGVSEQWRAAGAFMRAAAKGVLQAVEFWNLVGPSQNAPEKVALALDCRTACHGALIALEAAHAALPQVEIPHVTPRQQTAVKHGLVYMLTDMANRDRYRHTKHVLEGFQHNVEKSVQWVHNTYQETLKKDLNEADQNVMLVAKQLREVRKRFLAQRFGAKIYVRPALPIQ
ncbi:uncharacterized protein LOC129748787 isoform X2 [Uranotaenia lowii]|uniref:uncharacterized protein LOC129748787 isoform X2 n=1 Tax=Uranotaenia lowii TaxID=190385 RepID=UPI0024797DD9|nr:uncharacterized protein LOC129748787 isoform X2 [Uranotaenia lowii]